MNKGSKSAFIDRIIEEDDSILDEEEDSDLAKFYELLEEDDFD